MFNGPIPGQSLTREPKKYPWQRPPEVVDPNEAIMKHIENLEKPEVRDNLIFALEYGIPVKVLTNMLLTAAVSKGVHSIDVSLLINPVIHEYIINVAKDADAEYIEDFDRTAESAEEAQQKAVLLLKRSLKATPKKERDAGYDLLKEASEQPITQEEPTPEQEMPMAAPKGFMQRKVK